MDDKIAFVFDTNFIVQNRKLDAVSKQLDEKYVPYVTQVSIEERKAQQCNERKKSYEKIKEEAKQISSLVTIKSIHDLDTELDKFRSRIQQSYEKLFEGTVIKYDVSTDIFNSILNRAFEKIPPFNDSDNASDKGFKDTLMWLSIMEFFKQSGECEVIFLTDDKGFITKSETLTKEFEEYTGKKIQIKSNSTFGNLIENKKEKGSSPKKEIPNIESIRKQLRDLLDNICWTTDYNDFGDKEYYRSFLTTKPFDSLYIKSVMDDLNSIIQEHIFNDKIYVSVFLDKDNRIYDDRKIDIFHIESLNKLYKEILKNYAEHSSALINTISDRLNENYSDVEIITDSDVPF